MNSIFVIAVSLLSINAVAATAVRRKLEARVIPAYPKSALDDGRFGAVRIYCVVNSEGDVHPVRILKVSGSQDLDDSAMDAAAKWKWAPAPPDSELMGNQWNVLEFDFQNSTVTVRDVSREYPQGPRRPPTQ